jgi:hypothetical protein
MMIEEMITFPFPLTTTIPRLLITPLTALNSNVVRVNDDDDEHSNTLIRFSIEGLMEMIIEENELIDPQHNTTQSLDSSILIEPIT